METLSPEQTVTLRAAQKKRSRVVMALILVWIAGLFALTLVKGHAAMEMRAQPAAGHE